jgi:protein-tyrosine phosphatase
METYEIVPRVFFGPAYMTFQSEFINQITHVVNCDNYTSSSSVKAQLKHFLFLESYDDDKFPLLQTHLETLIKYIDSALENSNAKVYIHCYIGMNRSACLAVAYACYKTNKNPEELIKTLRLHYNNKVLSNEVFVKDLFDLFIF